MKYLSTYISILKSVKTRPTKYFYFLIATIVSLFLQAFIHNYNIVYIMMFLLVGVGGSSTLFGFYNLYYVQGKFLSHERFFAGKVGTYKLLFSNKVDEVSYDINITSDNETQYISSIKKNQNITIELTNKFDKRGKDELAKIKLHSLFPLPHELKYKFLNLHKELTIYPKPEGISLLEFYNKSSSLNGELDEFDGIKKFNQGDNPSYIHWSSLAKYNTLMLKNYQYLHEDKILHFDFEKLKGTQEERLSQLTLWTLECEKHHLSFTINLKNKILDSKKESIDAILTQLALF